ncbi:MAG TPA: hypothetical protein VHC20_02925 [Candidatus Paceibacterota bacterium]|nr:hypothetical protein [Candidatus Paceibacterota bacterium]
MHHSSYEDDHLPETHLPRWLGAIGYFLLSFAGIVVALFGLIAEDLATQCLGAIAAILAFIMFCIRFAQAIFFRS